MRNRLLYVLGLSCSLLLVGCQKEIQTVTAEIENYNGNGGKVYVDAARYACWHHGDKVMVNDKDNTLIIGPTEESDGATVASITMTHGETSPFTAAYPGEQVKSCMDGMVRITLPNVQTYRVKKSPKGELVQVIDGSMVAYTTDDHMTFRNAGALMWVNIPNTTDGDITVGSIHLIAHGGAKIWGMATVDAKTNRDEPVMKMNGQGGGTCVKLVIPNGHGAIKKGESKGFYIAVPPATAQYQVLIYYTDKAKKSQCFTSKKSINYPVRRNKIVEMRPNINDTAHTEEVSWIGSGTKEDPYQITNGGQLSNINNSTDGHAGDYFVQEGDITISDPNLFEKVGTAKNPFKGTYDGNGKKITFTEGEKAGVFGHLGDGAGVENLTVENHMDFTLDKKNIIQGIGGIADTIEGNNVTLKGCHTIGTIAVQNNLNGHDNQIYIGGICGFIKNVNMVTIENCSSDMDITVNSDKKNENCGYAGGICGYVRTASTVTLKNCDNTGNIAGNNVGGIIGVSEGASTIDRCANWGTISSGSNATNTSTAGGIVGYGIPASITNCANHGTVKEATECGGILGYGYNPNKAGKITIAIENSYSVGTIIGKSKSTTTHAGGIVGMIRDNYTLTMNNLYVGGTVTNGKWILDYGSYNANYIYSPSNVTEETGCAGTQKYSPTDWKVVVEHGEAPFLKTKLLENRGIGNEIWIGNTQPQLEFESRLRITGLQ